MELKFTESMPAAPLPRGLQPWITIADVSLNRHNRKYSANALQAMSNAIISGAGLISAKSVDDGQPDSMDDLLGVAVAARRTDGCLQVQVRWFTDVLVPVGMYVIPNGVATTLHESPGAGGALVLQGDEEYFYELEYLSVAPASAFYRATKITQ
jgi:hypothetical protein